MATTLAFRQLWRPMQCFGPLGANFLRPAAWSAVVPVANTAVVTRATAFAATGFTYASVWTLLEGAAAAAPCRRASRCRGLALLRGSPAP